MLLLRRLFNRRSNNLTGGGGGNGSLKLESLAITNPPIKTTYKSGESFDATGMVVTASYGYGITSDVTGYTVTPSVLTDEVTMVTITYTEGRVTKTVSTPVTVKKVLVSIDVTTPPTKTVYDYMESFDPAGMAVTATFSDGSTAPAAGYSYSDTAFFTHEAPSNKTIAVTAQFTTIYGVEWDWTSSGPTKGIRTDAAAGFGDPNPAVNNGTGSSPFDNLMP